MEARVRQLEGVVANADGELRAAATALHSEASLAGQMGRSIGAGARQELREVEGSRMRAREELTELSSLRAVLSEDCSRAGGELQAVLQHQLAAFTR